jgi:hypothetical protein
MRKKLSLSLIFSALALVACSKESPELIPCMCDTDTDSTLGMFDCMCEPAKKRPVRRISYLQDKQKVRYQSLIIDDEQYTAYTQLHQNRNQFAPIKLENVDFRIKKNSKYDEFDTKLGNYRFRIFGCRRETKNAYLNQGRTMQKDMHFFDVFYETLNDYYPVVVEPSNVYYPDSDKIADPEYLVTAEISDYFMNVCDEFDWDAGKNRKLRNGSSEITVVWRIMNIAKDQVYCRGTTTGYGQIMEGEPNGENLLVERAFEDALSKLPEISCVNTTLSQRVCPTDLANQKRQLRRYESCPSCFKNQYAGELRGIEMLQQCPYAQQNGSMQQTTTLMPVATVQDIAVQDVVIPCPAGQSSCVQTQQRGLTTPCTAGGAPCGQAPQIVEIETAGGIRDASVSVIDACQTAEVVEDGLTLVKNESRLSEGEDFFVDIPLEIERINENDVLEEGGSKGSGSNIAVNTIGESSYASVKNQFCIVNQAPFEDLNPQNLYKLRASIVSVTNASGKKGAGLIIADNLVLTSADLIQKDNNVYDLQTVNGAKFKASAFRVNPAKNVAALLLDRPTEYQPLPLSLTLPEVNKDILLTLGLLNFDEDGENYIDNEGKVVGYRWSEERGAEIIVDTFVQTVTLGGALIDQKGNVIGLAHEAKKSDNSPDLFIPIETALKSLGLEICGQQTRAAKPKAVQIYTPIADAIDNSVDDKSPKPMNGLKRK